MDRRLRHRRASSGPVADLFVLVGALAMTASVVLTGVVTLRHWGRS